MNPSSLTRATLALVLVGVLAGGIVLGSVVTAMNAGDPTPSPAPTGTARPSAQAELPTRDVDGEDIDRLPRYPGSVRTEYEVSVDSRYRLTAAEYLVDATVDEVRAFYQRVMDDHGWERADVNYAAGEWTYVLVDGRTEALIEIEEWRGLIEIDLQVSEPIQTPEPSRSPSPTPAPAPAIPPPPPPTPVPTDDDDDDDDDDGAWTEWSASDG